MKITPVLAAAFFAASFPLASSHAQPSGPILKPFALLGNPPPVQMLVPGFVVRELPVDLTNINNLVYAPDGRLFAYAYDGNVYCLTDTDGDGLEDKATLYYKNETDVLGSVGCAWGPGGLYLASRGRVVRLHERADGTAEAETAASGWAPPDKAGTRYLDVYGLAIDRTGNLYFGLGISDIRNAYRVNPDTGVSTYSRTWDRGTIQKITPDGKREIFATGLRYTVALTFNAAGDLFATDQEGATWLPNGNPFDELLHLQQGRHYGFPPRHPQYLPDVIDEPSLFDYSPQHQCACGVHFNEAYSAGGPIFGPESWAGDAFVAGESRGKIFRTKLVKSAAGYVARNETIAYLSMLTIDAVPTPQGDLIVTCHSGRPDWGSGPTGKGKLYKISYRDRGAPQPVLAYPASPTETRIIYDRPLDEAQVKSAAAHAVYMQGEYVVGGDRFESFRPGYQAVKDQQKIPRYQLPITHTTLSSDRRELVLQTIARTSAVRYSIDLREGEAVDRPADPAHHELKQQSAVDLQMDLTGAEAEWHAADGKTQWAGWLPHLDLAVARGFTAASANHAALFAHLREKGTLTLKAQLDLFSMLHPAVQPGAKLDFEYPPETVRLRFAAGSPVALNASGKAKARQLSDTEWELTLASPTHDWVPVELTLQTGAGEPRLDVSWSTAEDDRARPLSLTRILVPWADRKEATAWVGVRDAIPEIAGGDWQRGKKLFYGSATCAVCHQVNGQGGTFGPDLSNLVHRDYASVLQDIREPNATLNPDYVAVSLELKNGESHSGVLLQSWNQVYVLGQPGNEKLTFPRDSVVAVKPLGTSLMPSGLLDALTEAERKDLLTFLLTEPSEK